MVRLFTDDRATRSGGKDQAELLLRAIKLGQRRRFVRRPADLTVTGLAKALPYSWAALGSRNKSLQRPGASRSVRAARKYSGSPRSEDLPSVALNTQRALCEPVIGPLHHRSSTFSKIPCKFPANSLLPQKNSLLGIQKFPAPLRREFGCKPMDSLAEWRQKLRMSPKSSKIPCKFPVVPPPKVRPLKIRDGSP